MTDLCSKEVPVIAVDDSMGGGRVCRILDRLFVGRPLPVQVSEPNRRGRQILPVPERGMDRKAAWPS